MHEHHTPTPHIKRCTVCDNLLPAEMFYRRKSSKDGLRSDCKSCGSKSWKKYYQENQSRLVSGARRRYWDDPEKGREISRRYRERHPETVARGAKARRERNKKGIAQYNKKYWGKNRHKINQRKAEYREANRQKINEKAHTYRTRNRELILIRRREHYHRYPEIHRAYRQNNRARRQAAGGGVSAAEWREVLDTFGGKCAKCGSADNVHMDHVVPISKGGEHSPSNIQPLCQTCNLQKYTKIEDYRGKLYRPLSLPIDNDI